jgi:hypothetical protein
MNSPEIIFTLKEFINYFALTIIPIILTSAWWLSKRFSEIDARLDILENEQESQKRYVNTDICKMRDEISQMNALTRENRDEMKKELRTLKEEVISYVKDSNVLNINEHSNFSVTMKEIVILIKEIQSEQKRSEIRLSEHLAFHKGKENSDAKQ